MMTLVTNGVCSTVAILGILAIAAPANAQDGGTAQFYVGAQAGYHDLGSILVPGTGGPREFDLNGGVFGGYAGIDVPLGEALFAGLEANAALGTNMIDSEYGIAAHIGTRFGDSGRVFVRGGYQHVDFDLQDIFGQLAADSGLSDVEIEQIGDGIARSGDDSDGDFLIGAGAEIALSPRFGLRATIDTVSFDTVKLMAGTTVRF
jgi:hypothetical protein